MPRRRPGISASTQSALSFGAQKHPDVSAGPHAGDPLPAPPSMPTRIWHTPRPAPRLKRWRVVRLYRLGGDQYLEDIGAFHREEDAILLGTRELGHCRILDPNGRMTGNNGQPIEERTPLPSPAEIEEAVTMPTEMIPAPTEDNVTLMFERLARDPSVDVTKLERLIELQKSVLAHQAKASFDAAFAAMQGEIPIITEDGRILVEGELRSKYATNEAIQEVLRPILQRHGFSLRFRNTFAEGKQKIVGILSHRDGHSESDEFECPPDTSGKKNSIQAMGSTRSYGQRYTTIALLNIATRGTDDDGETAETKAPPDAPAGYGDWISDLEACADEGFAKWSATWNQSKQEYRRYLTKHDTPGFEAMKARAKTADERAS